MNLHKNKAKEINTKLLSLFKYSYLTDFNSVTSTQLLKLLYLNY